MHYYKRDWEESTGDEITDSWGTSTFYFETDENSKVVRQIQSFEKGQVLKYSTDFIEDEYGMLADQELDIDEFSEFSITEREFEDAWRSLARRVQ